MRNMVRCELAPVAIAPGFHVGTVQRIEHEIIGAHKRAQ
jgi:hypothetical protein